MGNEDVDLELGIDAEKRKPYESSRRLTQIQTKLISLIVGEELPAGSLRDSCIWYTGFLEKRFRSQWGFLRCALKGLPDEPATPQIGEFAIVYAFVIAVAELLKTKRDIALVEIVDHLDNNDFLKPQLDDQRAVPNQIVFAAIGWLTMLYEARLDPVPGKLEVATISMSALGYHNTMNTRKIKNYTQGFQYIDLPLHNLLTRFGELVPELGPISAREQCFSRSQMTECIIPQQVCWNILKTIVEVRIEWVSALSLHLEFDSGKKTLKLFRYPSYARMMSCDRRGNLLSQLLSNYTASRNGDVRAPDVPTEEFFREILLSYRLIFGQDERSWKAFAKMILAEKQSDVASYEAYWSCDPMLATLCGRSSTSPAARQIYEEIDASEPALSYEPNTDFQFFGRRLLELQSFVKQHEPRTLMALLRDRRDLNTWWTRWTNQCLIFFASLTILLVVLQLVFQVWQVLLAQQQLTLAQQQLDQFPRRIRFA